MKTGFSPQGHKFRLSRLTAQQSYIWLTLLLVLTGCTQDENRMGQAKEEGQKELLVFCGITMIDPVRELMSRFEKETHVKMTMSYGGSSDLMQSIKLNKVGDIYFPGSESFIIEADQEGLLKERQQVGVNQLAMFVRKGNPKKLTGNLLELLGSGLQVAIGHPELGSVGKETKKVLEAKGLYDQVVALAAMMQPDSKGLTTVLSEEKVDVVLNWKAVYFLHDNREKMDIIPIQEGAAKAHALTMAVVTYSQSPQLARAFLNLCASPQGQEVFHRYGF